MPDDALYARKIAQRHGIELHEIEIKPDVVDLLPRMVDILDEPTAIRRPSTRSSCRMRPAQRGSRSFCRGWARTSCSGVTANTWRVFWPGAIASCPAYVHRSANGVVKRLPVTAAGRGLRYARWAKRFVTFAELPEEAAFRRSYSLYAPAELAALLSPELQRRHRRCRRAAPRRSTRTIGESDQVNRMCLADTRMFLPGLNLAYTDRASMAASTEVRVPFVDPEVFRAAFSLVGKEKISGRNGKVALKQAAEAWLPRRSSIGQRRPFQRRSAPG